MYIDLHVHSYYSDGTESPAALVARAKDAGVQALAMTDHDTLSGVDEFLAAAKKSALCAVPGVEVSTSGDGRNIHVLGYNIDLKNEHFLNFLSVVAAARTENTRLIFNNLLKAGRLNYSWERVLRYGHNKEALYSADVFGAMKEDGRFDSWKQFPQFFYRYFGKDSAAFLSFDCYTAPQAVEAIIKAGGLPVLAHPKLIGDDSHIKGMVQKGLGGIEVYHPAHGKEDTERYLKIAAQYGLLVTGGSDWHGEMSCYDFSVGACGINQATFSIFKDRMSLLKKRGGV